MREHRGEDPVQLVGPRRGLLRAVLVIVRAFRILLQPRVLSGRIAQPRRGLGFAVHGQAKAVAERRVLGLEGLDARRRVVSNSNSPSLDSFLNNFAEPWRPRLV